MKKLNLVAALKRVFVPDIYYGERIPLVDRLVPVKVFDPCGRGTWYVLEWDRADMLFCYVVSPLGPDCDELGYVSVRELEAVHNRLGLPLEVDKHWDPKDFAEVAKAAAR